MRREKSQSKLKDRDSGVNFDLPYFWGEYPSIQFRGVVCKINFLLCLHTKAWIHSKCCLLSPDGVLKLWGGETSWLGESCRYSYSSSHIVPLRFNLVTHGYGLILEAKPRLAAILISTTRIPGVHHTLFFQQSWRNRGFALISGYDHFLP